MIEPAGDPASGRDPGLMPPSFATDYVEGAVKPFFLSSMHVGAPLQLPMIDLAYSKEKAVPAHIWGMLYDDWQPQLERDGLSVFLQGYENRGPDNERKRIYASATTSDLYDGAYAPKVQRFLDRLLDPATAGAPFMRRYLDAYFDLYWDLHLSTPFWRQRGLSGAVASSVGPICSTLDESPGDGTGAMLGFIGGDDARRWLAADAETRRRTVLEQVGRWFGPEALAPTHLHTQDWVSDDQSRGGPVMVMAPTLLSRSGSALRGSTGRLVRAGTEAAEKWTGYIDGAVRAGHAAADHIIEAEQEARAAQHGRSPSTSGST